MVRGKWKPRETSTGANESNPQIKVDKETMRGQPSKMDVDDDDSDEDANSPYKQMGQWAKENRDTASAVEIFKHAQDLGIEKKHKTVHWTKQQSQCKREKMGGQVDYSVPCITILQA